MRVDGAAQDLERCVIGSEDPGPATEERGGCGRRRSLGCAVCLPGSDPDSRRCSAHQYCPSRAGPTGMNLTRVPRCVPCERPASSRARRSVGGLAACDRISNRVMPHGTRACVPRTRRCAHHRSRKYARHPPGWGRAAAYRGRLSATASALGRSGRPCSRRFDCAGWVFSPVALRPRALPTPLAGSPGPRSPTLIPQQSSAGVRPGAG